MIGPKIYKRDTTGRVRFWQYEVEGDRWSSYSGIVDMNTVQSGWTACIPRSKATAEEQALFEAEAEMGKKLARDYSVSVELIDQPRAFGEPVMLAHKYEPDLFPMLGNVYSQPKLDGMRCKINQHGMWSRTGKLIVSCPHIFAILAPAFRNTPDLELDGELYNHDLRDDFPKLMSILRKSKPSEADLVEATRFAQFHVYDTYRPGKIFSERFRTLELFVLGLNVSEIVLVQTDQVGSTEQLDIAYGSYLQAGYEGQIVRLDTPYERKRSKGLLKRKEFETKEFELTAIEEGNGNWAGLAKRVRFRLPDGRECGGGIKGNATQAKDLLDRVPRLIGRPVTVRFFTPSPDGMPRFPVAIDFDRPDVL